MNVEKAKRLEDFFFLRGENLFNDDDDDVALFYDDLKCSPTKLTFAQTATAARSVRDALRRLASPGDVIGLIFDDASPLAPILMLGVLLSGAAFFCLEVKSWRDAVDEIGLRVFLFAGGKSSGKELSAYVDAKVEKTCFDAAPLMDVTALCIKKIPLISGPFPSSASLAYVMRTSGSTGVPKIVGVPHAAIVPNVTDLTRLFDVGLEDYQRMVFMASPLTFDPSIVEIFLSFATRSTLLMTSAEVRRSSTKLKELIVDRHPVSFLQTTPSLIRSPDHRLLKSLISTDSSLRFLFFGGERCPSRQTLRRLRGERNRTRLFNIYGVTEVSCWASLKEIDLDVEDDEVSIGVGMSETRVFLADAVPDDDGNLEGEIVIGAPSRVCYVAGDDAEIVDGDSNQRRTGDFGRTRPGDGEIVVVGRMDDQLKIFGRRTNLNEIKATIDLELSRRVNETDIWFEVVDVEGKFGVEIVVAVVAGSSNDESYRLLKECVLSVPRTRICAVESLPVSRHGKTDRESLRRLVRTQDLKRRRGTLDSVDLMTFLFEELSSVLRVHSDELRGRMETGENFVALGGDSFSAVAFLNRISDSITENLNVEKSPNFASWYEELVSGQALTHVMDRFAQRLKKSASTCDDGINQKGISIFASEKIPSLFSPKFKTKLRMYSYSSRNEQNIIYSSDETFAKWRDAFYNFSREIDSVKQNDKNSSNGRSGFVECWREFLGKCVDASPLLLCLDPTSCDSPEEVAIVFIGSHSRLFLAVLFSLLPRGLHRRLWSIELPDRVESDACVTRGGDVVVVGCRDGVVYFLDTFSGRTIFSSSTGDQIKASPIVDRRTGFVVVASRDGHLYFFEEADERFERRSVLDLAAGAIVATPASSDKGRLYVPTLGGVFFCLESSTPAILWRFSFGFPIFSSPALVDGDACIGCVDGRVARFRSDGRIVWTFKAEGPVFSSPTFSSRPDRVHFGCHDGFLYCVEAGVEKWRFFCGDDDEDVKVYASPFIMDVDGEEFVCVASSRGKIFLVDDHGRAVAVVDSGAELFSSPVVALASRKVLIGSRNDFLLCYDLDRIVLEAK